VNRRQALKIVASQYVVDAIRQAGDYGAVTWDDFPEIGENDWDQVVKLAEGVADRLAPHEGDVEDARDTLGSLAELEA
jgi:hypothetical protein